MEPPLPLCSTVTILLRVFRSLLPSSREWGVGDLPGAAGRPSQHIVMCLCHCSCNLKVTSSRQGFRGFMVNLSSTKQSPQHLRCGDITSGSYGLWHVCILDGSSSFWREIASLASWSAAGRWGLAVGDLHQGSSNPSFAHLSRSFCRCHPSTGQNQQLPIHVHSLL